MGNIVGFPPYCDRCILCRTISCVGCYTLYGPGAYQRPDPTNKLEVSATEIRDAQRLADHLFQNLSLEMILLFRNIASDIAHLEKLRIKQPLSNSEEINQMLFAGFSANWGRMFTILDKNPLIVNCIANDRAWGVIHQAAYFNEFQVVKRILDIPACDPFLRTKQDRLDIIGPGKTADFIAEDPKIKEIIIQKQIKKKVEFKSWQAPTFVEVNTEKDLEIRSILLVIASFHKSLYPETIKSDNSLTYSQLMYEVFEYINSGQQWKKARTDVGFHLQILGVEIGNVLLTGNSYGDIPSEKEESKESFFKRVIEMYTSSYLSAAPDSNNPDRSRLFYSALNRSLRTEGDKAKPTLGEDLAFAAYGVLLNAILMNWPRLKTVKRLLYRGLALEDQFIRKYKVKTEFAWLDFTSTSLDEDVAKIFAGKKALFIIENSECGKYSNKFIGGNIGGNNNEEEVIIPSGAKFLVTKTEKGADGLLRIWIVLLEY